MDADLRAVSLEVSMYLQEKAGEVEIYTRGREGELVRHKSEGARRKIMSGRSEKKLLLGGLFPVFS